MESKKGSYLSIIRNIVSTQSRVQVGPPSFLQMEEQDIAIPGRQRRDRRQANKGCSLALLVPVINYTTLLSLNRINNHEKKYYVLTSE